MSRLLKFRVWDTQNKIMHPVEDLSFGSDGDAKTIIAYWSNEGGRGYILDGESGHVMQFTGLLDKNGKEIYEGDIVRHGRLMGKMVWNQLKAQFGFFMMGEDVAPDHIELSAKPEVIGNIYQSPKLLT